MPKRLNRRICLASHPVGFPSVDDFLLVEDVAPEPTAGEMLCRTIYLSLDPYMRGRMNSGPSYAPGVFVGDVMVGGTVSQVVESKLDGYREGDFIPVSYTHLTLPTIYSV